MSFGKRFREARLERGLSQESIGQLFDPPLTRNTVSNWERGENLPEPDRLLTLARALRITVDYLLSGRGAKDSNLEIGPEIRGRVPLISWVQAGTWSTVIDDAQPGVADEWVETTVPIHHHTFALRVRGDSMTNPAGEPSFPDGSVIVVEPDAVGELDKMLNQFVIVKRTSDDEATFKQLVKDAGRYYLKPLNPRYPMIELREDDVFCAVVRERLMRFF